jgi:hypothetical protein
MRRFIVILILAIAIYLPASGQERFRAAGSDSSKAEQAVLQVMNSWLDALKRGDLADLERIIADDYQITVSDGKVLNRTQDLEPLRAGMKFINATTEDVRVRIFKETAVVTGKGMYRINFNGKEFDVRERFTDIYVRRKGVWQPVASHSTTLKQ